MTETVIEIDRVPLSFVAAAGADRAERVSRRVRDAVARTLSDALATACGRDLDADESYVFIDRIDVQCTVGGHWTDDAIARVFAERVAQALVRERQYGQALVFHDRAEYVSAFLAGAVDGGAPSRWWFAEFEGLRHLPRSALIRTIVSAEGETGWEALARLSEDVLRRAVSALTAADTERILDGIPAESAAGPSLEALIEAFESSVAAPFASAAQRELAALVHLVRTGRTAPSSAKRAAVRGLAALAAWVREPDHHRRVIEGGSVHHHWREAAGVDDAARQAVARLDSPALDQWVRSRVAGRDADTAVNIPVTSFDFTPFGGALLLAVVLVRSGSWHGWRDTLRVAGLDERADTFASWLALAVAGRALTPTRAAAVERDPVLRRVFGIPPAMGISRGTPFARWARSRARTLLVEMSRRIPGCEGSTAGYLRRHCLAFPAGVSADGGQARLGKAPLDVLLVLSGLTRATVTLPDGRSLALRSEEVY